MYAYGAQVAIDGYVVAVADHDELRASILEHGAHLTVEDSPRACPGTSKNVYSLIVERHILKSFDCILPEMAYYAV